MSSWPLEASIRTTLAGRDGVLHEPQLVDQVPVVRDDHAVLREKPLQLVDDLVLGCGAGEGVALCVDVSQVLYDRLTQRGGVDQRPWVVVCQCSSTAQPPYRSDSPSAASGRAERERSDQSW